MFGDTVYTGVPNLVLAADMGGFQEKWNVSDVGAWFIDDDNYAPGTTLSYAEVCFLKAEAALKGWGGGDPETQYNNGVRANMNRLGITPTAIDSFLNGAGQYAGTLEQIITQKWLTFVYQDAYEAFAEYRRTGFPVLTNFDGTPVDPATVPQRLPYPLSEVSLNGTNVQAVGHGINEKTTKVWWAK